MENNHKGFYKGLINETLNNNDQAIFWSGAPTKNNKSFLWYSGLAFVVLAISILFYVFTKDLITSLVFVFCGLIIGFYSLKNNSVLEYSINSKSIRIGSRSYLLGEFKYFSVSKVSGGITAMLVPLKKFRSTLYIYIDPNQADSILKIISNILPNEKYTPSITDRIFNYLNI